MITCTSRIGEVRVDVNHLDSGSIGEILGDQYVIQDL